ncbi:RsmD family RNA methyltransferase [uncultured Desulfovibrio sp.]|uniref:class I SAM-dependent RNA methyltransferase n=1 Tax=uncultured Desulfovibrio sp. TaxID=167968 RepID=UPI00260D1AA3|nr:RsmD family RNA methyltransferase [uncultured Desulfovibrio sp.]
MTYPLLDLDILAPSPDGRGVARTPEGVVFVRDALPGQRVRARLLQRRARFAEAQSETVLTPAPGQLPPLCPHQSRCGGCPWQCLPAEAQHHWKTRLLTDAMQRIGGFARLPLETLRAATARTGFRNKMEFAFGPADDGGLALGLRRRGTLEVMDVPGCVLLPPEAMAMVDTARRLALDARQNDPGLTAYVPPRHSRQHRPPARNRREQPGFWRFLTLRSGFLPDTDLTAAAALSTPQQLRYWAVCLTSPGNAARRAAVRRLGEALLDAHPLLTAFVHEERQQTDALVQGERRVLVLDRHGAPQAHLLRLPLHGQWFTLDAASFFQVNTVAAQQLAALSTAMLTAPGLPEENGNLLDLYCGAGAPGLLAGRHFRHTLGMEYDPRAVALARRNAAALGVQGSWQSGDAARLLRKMDAGPGHFAAALADPPRAGMDADVLERLLALRPQRLVYVSCNPATLARDAARLATAYALTRLVPVDLFPHTPHLESVSLWERP